MQAICHKCLIRKANASSSSLSHVAKLQCCAKTDIVSHQTKIGEDFWTTGWRNILLSAKSNVLFSVCCGFSFDWPQASKLPSLIRCQNLREGMISHPLPHIAVHNRTLACTKGWVISPPKLTDFPCHVKFHDHKIWFISSSRKRKTPLYQKLFRHIYLKNSVSQGWKSFPQKCVKIFFSDYWKVKRIHPNEFANLDKSFPGISSVKAFCRSKEVHHRHVHSFFDPVFAALGPESPEKCKGTTGSNYSVNKMLENRTPHTFDVKICIHLGANRWQ